MKTNVFRNDLRTTRRFPRLVLLAILSVFSIQIGLSQHTAWDVISESPEHTILETALIAASLNDDLMAEGPMTVFAPTDAAFNALPEGTVATLLEDPTGELAQILLYHVVGGVAAMSGDLSDGQMITTLNGDSVTVKLMNEDVYIDTAMVTQANIEVENGVVHVIDAVLIPTSTVVDIIVGSPAHTILEQAVIAAGLADDLSGEGPFTVFAPTDAAFAGLPEGLVSTLLQDPTGELAQILLYHVVGGVAAKSGDLTDGQMITTLNGDSVTVKLEGGNVYIDEAMVTLANLEADNGVVHVIDAVLIPEATTSIRENRKADIRLNVYPNPSTDYFNVSFSAESQVPYSIGLYDLQGKLHKSRSIDAGFRGEQTIEFPVADMEEGIYILTIQTPTDRIARRVSIRK